MEQPEHPAQPEQKTASRRGTSRSPIPLRRTSSPTSHAASARASRARSATSRRASREARHPREDGRAPLHEGDRAQARRRVTPASRPETVSSSIPTKEERCLLSPDIRRTCRGAEGRGGRARRGDPRRGRPRAQRSGEGRCPRQAGRRVRRNHRAGAPVGEFAGGPVPQGPHGSFAGKADEHGAGSFADSEREVVTSYPDGVERMQVVGHRRITRLLTDAGLDEASAKRDVEALHSGRVLVLWTWKRPTPSGSRCCSSCERPDEVVGLGRRGRLVLPPGQARPRSLPSAPPRHRRRAARVPAGRLRAPRVPEPSLPLELRIALEDAVGASGSRPIRSTASSTRAARACATSSAIATATSAGSPTQSSVQATRRRWRPCCGPASRPMPS